MYDSWEAMVQLRKGTPRRERAGQSPLWRHELQPGIADNFIKVVRAGHQTPVRASASRRS
jgi:hypothetical protein